MYIDHQIDNQIVFYTDHRKKIMIGGFHSIPEYHDYWQFWLGWGTIDIAFKPVYIWAVRYTLRTENLTDLLRFDLQLPTLFICLRLYK